jgi:transposase InsO family protein
MGPTLDKALPARYHSRKFNRAQQNYFTTEQELLGIVDALEAFADLLIGHRFRVATDHQPLRYFWSQRNLSRRQHRWAQLLAKFDFVVDYLPGKLNGSADGLSRVYEIQPEERLPDHEYVNIMDDFSESLGLSPLAVTAAITHGGEEEPPNETPITDNQRDGDRNAIMSKVDPEFVKKLRAGYDQDRLFHLILERPDHFAHFVIKDDMIFAKLDDGWRLCIPKGPLRGQVIAEVHNVLGHLGNRKTVDGVRRYFWWGSLVGDVSEFCRTCEICARTKAKRQLPFGLLHTLPVPTRPWQMVACDFVGPLPKSKYRGVVFDYLITFTCAHSKQCHLIRWHTTGNAEQFADVFFEAVVRLHGLPEVFVSDRDKLFTSNFWKGLQKRLGVKAGMSTAYHPQTDGSSERTNQTVMQVLRAFVEFQDDQWANKLGQVEFAINSAPSASTGLSPFEVVHGFRPQLLPLLLNETPSGSAESFSDAMVLRWIEATDSLIAARVRQTHHANKRRRDDAQEFEVGRKAYLSTEELKFPDTISRKFIPRYLGPFPITWANPRTSNYELELLSYLSNIHPRFHASRLAPHYPNDDDRFPNRALSLSPPVEVDGSVEYEVERILLHRRKRGKLEFYIRWKGYGAGDDTWEAEESLLPNAQELLEEYAMEVGLDRGAQTDKKRGKGGKRRSSRRGGRM